MWSRSLVSESEVLLALVLQGPLCHFLHFCVTFWVILMLDWFQEDNKVNQMVAQRLLNNLHCTVDVACNGVEAIGLLERSNAYDIIFMDCHMPVSSFFLKPLCALWIYVTSFLAAPTLQVRSRWFFWFFFLVLFCEDNSAFLLLFPWVEEHINI